MFKGFREFLMRGNVIDLAVAVVIGAAFTSVVNSIVNGLMNPLIGAIFKSDSLDTAFMVPVPGTEAVLSFGLVLGALLNFVIIAAVVYFVFVLPVNTLRRHAAEKLARGETDADEVAAETELTLLVEIRDLLKAQRDS